MPATGGCVISIGSCAVVDGGQAIELSAMVSALAICCPSRREVRTALHLAGAQRERVRWRCRRGRGRRVDEDVDVEGDQDRCREVVGE